MNGTACAMVPDRFKVLVSRPDRSGYGLRNRPVLSVSALQTAAGSLHSSSPSLVSSSAAGEKTTLEFSSNLLGMLA